MRCALLACLCVAALVAADVILLQDDDPRLAYSGTWTKLSSGPGLLPYGGGSVHWTNAAGATVGLRDFAQGAHSDALTPLTIAVLSFALLATTGPRNSPAVSVQVDGVQVGGNIDLSGVEGEANKTVWTSAQLDPSVPHSVVVRRGSAVIVLTRGSSRPVRPRPTITSTSMA